MMTTGFALLLLLIQAFSPNCAETTSGSLAGIHNMNANHVTSDGSSVTHASNSGTKSHPSNNDVHVSTSSQHGPVPEPLAVTHGMPPIHPSPEHDMPMSTSSQHGPVPEPPTATHGMPPIHPSPEHDMPMSTSSQHGPVPEPPTATHGMPPIHPSPEHDMPMSTSSHDLPPETSATTHPPPPKLSTDDDVILSTTPEDDLPPETSAATHPPPPKLSTDDDVILSTTPEDATPSPPLPSDLPLSDLRVRLVGGRDRCSGRLEVSHLGEWGAVCDDHWDMNDAEVVCRELGCGSVVNIPSFNHSEEHDRPDLLEDVMCLGNESSLVHCQHSGFGEHDCKDHRDAGVVCSGVRLVGGRDRCSGRLEVYHLGEWGAVCDDHWDMNDAEVVCRELGCGSVVNIPSFNHSEEHDRPDFLEDVMCFGNESSLAHCQHSGFGEHDCKDHRDAGVVCSASVPVNDQCPSEIVSRTICDDVTEVRDIFLLMSRILSNSSAQVRLVDGNSRCSGRVEVLHDGQWGTVCDDRWDMNNAEVVCREMGCGRALGAAGNAHFGQGSGPIWLNDVKCKGSESSLKECQHRGFGENNCSHHKDAAAICSGMNPLVGILKGH